MKSLLSNTEGLRCTSEEQYNRVMKLCVIAGFKTYADHAKYSPGRPTIATYGGYMASFTSFVDLELISEAEFVAKMFGVAPSPTHPDIMIGEHWVDFSYIGHIKVGCTTIPYSTVRAINEHCDKLLTL